MSIFKADRKGESMNLKQNEQLDVIKNLGIHDGNGTITRRRFFKGLSKLPINFEIWELPPGTSEGTHRHDGESPLEEFYYFISGQGKMWVGTETFEIKPGDAVMAPPDLDHGFENTGDKTLKLAIIWGKPEE